MPLVAHTELPTYARLREEGQEILTPQRARCQDIREMHIGLLNMMPDSAIEATERQFFRLVGAANPIVQFHLHPFTLPGLARGQQATEHFDKYYETFGQIRAEGLDGLIISGANVSGPQLHHEPFWNALTEVFDWAETHVASVLCSCLATHALFQYVHGTARTHLGSKRWGVYSHRVIEPLHPLVSNINTRFDVPHSRFNEIFREDMEAAGLRVLVESEEAGVHLAVSQDGFRVVYMQGHPEYDTISLLKEYKREILRYHADEREDYPPLPEHYFGHEVGAVLSEFARNTRHIRQPDIAVRDFPEDIVLQHLDNTWRDTAKAVFNNWLGGIYRITDQDRRIPFMAHINPDNPLDLDYL